MSKKKIIKNNISHKELEKILNDEDLNIELGKLLDETEKEPLKLKLLDFDLDSIPILDYELPLIADYDIDISLLDYELPLIPEYDIDLTLLDYELPQIPDYELDLTLLDYDLEQLKKER